MHMNINVKPLNRQQLQWNSRNITALINHVKGTKTWSIQFICWRKNGVRGNFHSLKMLFRTCSYLPRKLHHPKAEILVRENTSNYYINLTRRSSINIKWTTQVWGSTEQRVGSDGEECQVGDFFPKRRTGPYIVWNIYLYVYCIL